MGGWVVVGIIIQPAAKLQTEGKWQRWFVTKRKGKPGGLFPPLAFFFFSSVTQLDAIAKPGLVFPTAEAPLSTGIVLKGLPG